MKYKETRAPIFPSPIQRWEWINNWAKSNGIKAEVYNIDSGDEYSTFNYEKAVNSVMGISKNKYLSIPDLGISATTSGIPIDIGSEIVLAIELYMKQHNLRVDIMDILDNGEGEYVSVDDKDLTITKLDKNKKILELEELPDFIVFKNKEDLAFPNLKRIPDSARFRNKGDLSFEEAKDLVFRCYFENRGDLFLPNITSIIGGKIANTGEIHMDSLLRIYKTKIFSERDLELKAKEIEDSHIVVKGEFTGDAISVLGKVEIEAKGKVSLPVKKIEGDLKIVSVGENGIPGIVELWDLESIEGISKKSKGLFQIDAIKNDTSKLKKVKDFEESIKVGPNRYKEVGFDIDGETDIDTLISLAGDKIPSSEEMDEKPSSTQVSGINP